MIKFGLLYFTGTVVWKSRQMWNLSRRTWGTAASAAAWTKPAVAAPLPALKVPVAANAAACSMTATSAPCPTARRNPLLWETRAAEERGAAAKEGVSSATSRAAWRFSPWSSAAQTPPSSTPLPWAAACRRWPSRTAATSHQSSAAPTQKPHRQLTPTALLQWTFNSPPQPSVTSPSHLWLRWSTIGWSSVCLKVWSPPTAFCHHLPHPQKRGGLCI